jgi:hypothetical protein
MRRARRHTNTKGIRQVKTGKTAVKLSRICRRLNLPFLTKPSACFVWDSEWGRTVWGVNLTEDEIAGLKWGLDPETVRPEHIVEKYRWSSTLERFIRLTRTAMS